MIMLGLLCSRLLYICLNICEFADVSTLESRLYLGDVSCFGLLLYLGSLIKKC